MAYGQIVIKSEYKNCPTFEEAEKYIIKRAPELLPVYGHFLRFNITENCVVKFYLIGSASADANDNWG